MKKVIYHQEHGDKEFVVLAENGDGTIDIGPEGGVPVVTRCRVVETREIGCATLVGFKAAKPPKDTKPPKVEVTEEAIAEFAGSYKLDELKAMAAELQLDLRANTKAEIAKVILEARAQTQP
jgi:hypothetical protein